MESLLKYNRSGSFIFYLKDSPKECFAECNAPRDASGVYLIYGLREGIEELVYIGKSGKLLPDGTMQHRLAGLGGIKDRLINGKHTYSITEKKVTRYIFWKEMMVAEKFEILKISWYVTHGYNYCDSPDQIERYLINKYNPKWNRN